MKDALYWNCNSSFFCDDDITQINVRRLMVFEKIFDGALGDLNSRCNGEMNEKNYQFATQEIIPLMGDILSKLKIESNENTLKEYTGKKDSSQRKLDGQRDKYLVTLMTQISDAIKNGDKKHANLLLSELYHHSEDAKIKKEWLPLLKTSYKEYWNNKSNEIRARLENE